MLAHDPAFGFHLMHISRKKAQKAQNVFLEFKSWISLFFYAFYAFCGNYSYSANHPFVSRSLTPTRLVPSISSIQEPFTSASSLPPKGGTNFTCEPSGISTSIRSVAPPRLIFIAFAFAVKDLPDASVPSTSKANSTGTRGLRGRCDATSPRGPFSVIQSPPFLFCWQREEGLT